MATKTKTKKAKNLYGTDYDRFAMGGGGVKPINAESKYTKKKKSK